jgi:hypothetical protein
MKNIKVIKFSNTNAVKAIQNILNKNNRYKIIDLWQNKSFSYEEIYHIKTCDFILNDGTFGSDHPKRQWRPNVECHKTALMNFRNDFINGLAKTYNKKIIYAESATLSRIKCNYIKKFYKDIPPRFYRLGLGHWVYSHTKWCKSEKGRLKNLIKTIEEKNSIKITNVFDHKWKNNKDGHILILPGLEDDSTSSVPVQQFVENSVKEIKKHTQRKIVVKAHPHSKLTYKNLDVEVITGDVFLNELAKETYCAVLDSSTSIFQLINLGIPVFTTKHSFGYPLGNYDLTKIENINYADSNKLLEWYEQMASTEFTITELGSSYILDKIEELLNE